MFCGKKEIERVRQNFVRISKGEKQTFGRKERRTKNQGELLGGSESLNFCSLIVHLIR